MSKKKLGTAIIITVIVVPLILMFVFKPSFTAKGAVEKHFEYDDTLHYINQIEAGAFEAWVYEDRQEELYKTFLVKKEGFFYESNHSTYVEKKDDSALETISVIDFTDEKDAVTLLIVRSSDERINSIEAGRESNRKVKEVEEGDVVVFSWDESVPFDVMNAVAYDEQEEALFYYGFPEDEANLDASDVGWHEQ